MQSNNLAEQIEMLKQQISVYADDFANERADRERIQTDREAQKERLKEFEREIALLKEQVDIIHFTSIYSWLWIIACNLPLSSYKQTPVRFTIDQSAAFNLTD